MRWRRSAALVAVAVSVIAAIATTPAAAKLGEDVAPCVLDPDTGACVPDRDRDGRGDTTDNCPDHYNPGQEDNDRDSVGNPCDSTPNGEPPPGGGGGGGGGGSSSCQSSAPVVLYEHVGYAGRCWGFWPGSHAALGDAANNQASSIRVAAGYVVTLFTRGYFDASDGRHNTETTDNPWGWTGVGNDAVSSLVVQVAPPDATYYDGAVVEDSVASEAASAASRCARVGDGIKHQRPGRVHWRFNFRVRFCWDGAKVTDVWDHDREAVLTPLPWPLSLVQAWAYQPSELMTATAGHQTTIAYARGIFEFCTWKNACMSRREPWVRITLRGDGTASCESSVRTSSHPCYRGP